VGRRRFPLSLEAICIRQLRLGVICGLVVFVLAMQTVGAVPVTPAPKAAPVELRIGFLEALDKLNPFQGLNDPSFEFYGLVYDYLYSFDQDGNFVPSIAVNAVPDATSQNWTYWIRQDVNWSDGTPLTAADVAFTINYNAQNFNLLWNYEPYANRIVSCGVPSTQHSYVDPPPGAKCQAQVTSPWNVTVYFDRPFVPGKALFFPIIPRSQWFGIALDAAQYRYDNCPTSTPPGLIGSGPFVADSNICTQWSQHQPIAVHKNPNYHPVGSHTGPSNIDTIYMIQFLDESQMVYALQTGAIDMGKFSSAGYESLAGASGIQRQEGLISTQYWNEIGISQYDTTFLNPARYDENVRRAMAMATNKDYILKTIYGGHGVRGDSLMTRITPEWWYDPTSDSGANLTFDISAANALLDRAGYDAWWTDRSGARYRQANRTITFTDTNGKPRTIAQGTQLIFTMDVRKEFLQEQAVGNYLVTEWARIGIKLVPTTKLENSLSKDVYGGKVDTYIWYWSGDPDPNYLLSIQSGFTLDGWNDNFWDNASYNALYVKQLSDTNFTQRQIDVRAAEKLNYESAVYIIYIFPYGEWAWRTDRFTGWGDWNAHPYRQMDAFWGANPLFFDLAVMGGPVNNPPTKPILAGTPPITAFVNQSVTFIGNSTDPDPGETLTWAWHWGEGNQTIHSTTSAAQGDTASYKWVASGFYNVTLTVSDGALSATSDPFEVHVVPVVGPLGWVNGTVKDSTTQLAISGAGVRTTPGSYSGLTDSTGAYGILLPVGTYAVTASASLYESKTTTGVTVSANAMTAVNFLLVPARGWIAGTVRSAAGNTPIAGAAIYIYANGGAQYAVTTNSQGSYNKSLTPGQYSVNASATGYLSSNKTGIVVVDGQTQTVDFSLNPVPQPPAGLSPLVIAGTALGIVIVLVAAAVLLIMRRRKKEEEEGKIEIPTR